MEISAMGDGPDPMSQPMPSPVPEEKHRTLRRLSGFCPWPRCCPWLVIVVGVALGTVVGLTPWLFVAIGCVCLLSGCLPEQT